MDPQLTGRVPLRNFYSKGRIGYWHLRESVDFLRQLGALDESSRTPQVIIPNYVTAVSNCEAPSQYFSICCIHECESLMNRLEAQVRGPSAEPQQILEIIGNLSSSTMLAP